MFQADGAFIEIANTQAASEKWMAADENGRFKSKWRAPATMPAWAIRSWIKVQTVAVKRVQEMTTGDAVAWGILKDWPEAGHSFPEGNSLLDNAHAIWNHHHSRRGLGVPGNPWCWSYTVEQAKK
jgi:hypothetical protein